MIYTFSFYLPNAFLFVFSIWEVRKLIHGVANLMLCPACELVSWREWLFWLPMPSKGMVWMQEQCFIDRSRQIQKGNPKSKLILCLSIRWSADRFKSAGLNSRNKTGPVNTREVDRKKASHMLGQDFGKIQRKSGLLTGIVWIRIMWWIYIFMKILGNGILIGMGSKRVIQLCPQYHCFFPPYKVNLKMNEWERQYYTAHVNGATQCFA